MRLAAILSAFLLAGCSVFGDRSGTPEVPYEVIERLGEDLEVRRYGPRTVAEVRLAEGEGGPDDAFRVLFRYISGANLPAEKIAMTAPVETARGAEIAMTAPVETAAGEAGGIVMRFFLPAGLTAATAPNPTDPRVTLHDLPGRDEAALRFTGPVRPARAYDLEGELSARLASAGWRMTGEVRAAYHDGPFTLPWLRRNEAVAEVTRAGG